MTYPDDLIHRFGGVPAFAAAATAHHLAPRRQLDPAAVYMWKRRNVVPFMWRPVVAALSASREAAA